MRKRRGVLTLQINNPVTLVPLVELSSTATMAMGACGCSLAMRLSVVTSVVNPLRSATASSSLSGSERQSWKTATPPRRRRATVGVARVGAATRRRQGGPSRVGPGAGGAVGIAGCGGTDGRRPGTKDGSGRPTIDLEVLQELVQRNAVLDPVEKLLDGKARPAETGHTAHARGINPNGFLELHGTIRACFGKRLHGRSRFVRCEPILRGYALGVPAFYEPVRWDTSFAVRVNRSGDCLPGIGRRFGKRTFTRRRVLPFRRRRLGLWTPGWTAPAAWRAASPRLRSPRPWRLRRAA